MHACVAAADLLLAAVAFCFLVSPQVDIEESGEGQGGYAKEMSKEFIEAEVRQRWTRRLLATHAGSNAAFTRAVLACAGGVAPLCVLPSDGHQRSNKFSRHPHA
jgi:hypothetical protein